MLPVAWICTFYKRFSWHIKLFLQASTYLFDRWLCHASVLIGFLIAFYRSSRERRTLCDGCCISPRTAAFAAYTWMRPMGQFASACCGCFILINKKTTTRQRGEKQPSLLFYFQQRSHRGSCAIRNLLDHSFSAHSFDLYLNVFNALKFFLCVAKNPPQKKLHSQMTAAAYQLTQEAEENTLFVAKWPVVNFSTRNDFIAHQSGILVLYLRLVSLKYSKQAISILYSSPVS